MRNRWRKGTAFVAALVLAIFCQTALSQQGSDTKPIVLKGATVIDGLGGSPISEAVVLIEGDRIKAVGAKGTSHPSDATVVDLSGKVIIPGLIDSHTHYEEWMGEMFLNHGVTSFMRWAATGAERRNALSKQMQERRGSTTRSEFCDTHRR
jgi:predicted amidohydrolase YtcJ